MPQVAAPNRRSAPSWERKEEKAPPQPQTTFGADESRPDQYRRDALIGERSDAVLQTAMGAGCLTCESETARPPGLAAKRQPRSHAEEFVLAQELRPASPTCCVQQTLYG